MSKVVLEYNFVMFESFVLMVIFVLIVVISICFLLILVFIISAFCFCCFAEKSASHGQRHQPAVARASDAGDWRLSARVTDYVDFCFHTKAHEEHTRGSTTHGD